MQRFNALKMYGRHNTRRLSAPEIRTNSYREEFLRRKQLQKTFKGTEKGLKTLGKLSETIHNGMEVLWRQKLMCDIEIITSDGMTFLAHKIVLASCSDYFYDAFVDNQARADDCQLGCYSGQMMVAEVSGDVFGVILDALYTGKVKVEASNVDDILSASFTLGVFSLVDASEEFLVDHVRKDNCLQFLDTAFKYSLNKLTDTALEIAASHFQTVSKKPAFKNLKVEHLIPMLKRDDLEISNELEVFNKIRVWIEENKESRLQDAGNLMATIRLPLLDPITVVDNVECWGYLMEVPECQKYVKDALHYHCMPARQCNLQSPRTVPRLKSEVSLIMVGGAPRVKTDRICDEVLKLNSAARTWEHVTRMPEPRHHHGVAAFNGFLYVAGGEASHDHSTTLKTVCRYDPRTRSWMTVSSLNQARHSFQLVPLNGTLFVVGGGVGKDECLATVERYNPAVDKWEEVASLSGPRRSVAVETICGKLYAAGGTGDNMVYNRVEKYYPADNRWEVINPVNIPRFFGHLVHVQNHLYLIGGATVDNNGGVVCVEAIERFSPQSNQWTVITKLQSLRSEYGCTAVNGKIYLIGGYNWNTSERLAGAECLNTETGTMTALPDIPQPLTGVGAVTLTLFNHQGATRSPVSEKKGLLKNEHSLKL